MSKTKPSNAAAASHPSMLDFTFGAIAGSGAGGAHG